MQRQINPVRKQIKFFDDIIKIQLNGPAYATTICWRQQQLSFAI